MVLGTMAKANLRKKYGTLLGREKTETGVLG